MVDFQLALEQICRKKEIVPLPCPDKISKMLRKQARLILNNEATNKRVGECEKERERARE